MVAESTILELRNVTKDFGGLRAINGLSCAIPKAKVTALIGPNGAGKTTAVNMISGVYKPTSGDILFQGESLVRLAAHEIIKKGIARTFQITKLFAGMSVIENVLLGIDFGFKGKRNTRELHSAKAQMDYASEILKMFNLSDYARKMTNELSLGQQRWLELARAIAMDPLLLLLDEPSSGLNMAEAEALLDKLRVLCKEGRTILLIEHNMRVMSAISDYVIVLNHGERLLTGTPDEIKRDPKVIEVYLGKE